MIATCSTCKRADQDCRPYGVDGAAICFDCAFASPEAEAQTEAGFNAAMDAAGELVVLTEDGPKSAREREIETLLETHGGGAEIALMLERLNGGKS